MTSQCCAVEDCAGLAAEWVGRRLRLQMTSDLSCREIRIKQRPRDFPGRLGWPFGR